MGAFLFVAAAEAARQRQPEWVEELRFAPSVPDHKEMIEEGEEEPDDWDDSPSLTWDTERFLWVVCLVAAGGFFLGFVARELSVCQPIAVTVHLNALLHQP